MSIIARAKPDPPSADTAEFDAARERWQKIDAEFQALLTKHEKLRVAASLVRNPVDSDADRGAWAREFAKEYISLARRRPATVAAQSQELEYLIDDAAPQHQRERETFQAAQSRETSRRAIGLQDRQRAAVRAMATALENLSRAMADERAVRDELAKTAPNQTSGYLPDCSIPIAGLDSWDSIPSHWARRMRKIGLL